jgi:hypothetical protein
MHSDRLFLEKVEGTRSVATTGRFATSCCTPVPQLLFDLTSPASTQFYNFFFDVHVNLDKLCNNTCMAAGFLKPIGSL